jgi:hypothetical protein
MGNSFWDKFDKTLILVSGGIALGAAVNNSFLSIGIGGFIGLMVSIYFIMSK